MLTTHYEGGTQDDDYIQATVEANPERVNSAVSGMYQVIKQPLGYFGSSNRADDCGYVACALGQDLNSADMTNIVSGYDWGRSAEPVKDTQKSMLWFHGHIFNGKYLRQWKEEGINPFELHRAGFLSYDYCSSWKARQLGKTNFFYINQNKAKEIYKAYKSGFFK